MSKKKNLEFGGYSLPTTINFIGNKWETQVDYDNKKIIVGKLIIKKNSKFWGVVKKIPFIRGPLIIARMICFMLYGLFKRSWMLIAVYILLGATLAFGLHNLIKYYSPADGMRPSSFGLFMNSYSSILLYVFVLVFISWTMKTIRENHAIEHKVINAYEFWKKCDIKSILRASNISKRCGGVFAAWYLMFFVFGAFSGFNYYSWYNLIIFSLSYECFLLAQKKGFIGDLFFTPGWAIQHWTTKKIVDPYKTLLAASAFRMLLRKEGVLR